MWVWELWHGEKFLGKLVENERDFPWVICDFVSTPEFEAGYRVLFDHENTLADDGSNEDAWDEYYSQNIDSLNLEYRPMNSSTPQPELVLIHIYGDRADLRPIFTTKHDE